MVKKPTEPSPEPETVAIEDPNEPGVITIQTANLEICKFRIPTGPLGAKHFLLCQKAAPKSMSEDGTPSPADNERVNEVYVQWMAEILPDPSVMIYPDYKDMRGEDQFVVAVAACNAVRVRQDLFRLIAGNL